MRAYIFLMLLSGLSHFSWSQSYDQINRADRLYSSNQLEQALQVYQDLAVQNPVNGLFNYRLGLIYKKLDQPEASIKQFEAAMKVGYRKPYCISHITENYAKAENYKATLAWVKKGLEMPKSISFDELLNDEVFAGFRISQQFGEIDPFSNVKTLRKDRWQRDIEFLRTSVKQNYYGLNKDSGAAAWEVELNKLKQAVERMTDVEIAAKLFRVTAMLGDGHTFVRPPLQGDMAFHHFPLKLYQFKEGVYITAAAEEYNKHVGAKLVAIEGRSIEELIKVSEEIISVDNSMGYKENINFLMLAELLQELGVKVEDTTVRIRLEKDGVQSEFRVKAGAFNPEVWSAMPVAEGKVPLWATRANEFYWFEELPELKALYMHINFNYSAGPNDTDVFYDTAFAYMKEKGLERLVIDLRNCPGGNSFTNAALIKHIIAHPGLNKKGNIFTVIGRKTFSAAMNLSTDLEYWTETIFIGEPTGSSPNFIGETNFVTLPYSKLGVSISNAYWQGSTSWDHRHWIAPDILKEPTIADYNSGGDSVLEYILEFWSE